MPVLEPYAALAAVILDQCASGGYTLAGYGPMVDEEGDMLKVSSGEFAIFSAADDGAGPHSVPLFTARPGTVPPVHGPPSPGIDPGLLLSTAHTAYKLKVRW